MRFRSSQPRKASDVGGNLTELRTKFNITTNEKTIYNYLESRNFFLTFAQENAPKIKGKVKISIIEGTFDCDLTISNIPTLEDYLIRLNSGMNLLHIKSKPNDFAIWF